MQKFFLSVSPSRIDFIGRADRTCQVVHPVIKKNTQKYQTLLTERPLPWTQKLSSRDLTWAPIGEGREDTYKL